MKVDRTKYTAHYENGIVVSQWISVEMELDGGNGESPLDALDRSQALVEQWYKSKNLPFEQNSVPPGPPQFIQVKPEDREIGVTPESITSSPDLKVLETYRWLIKGKPELERAYILRYEQLTTLTTTQ
jgi:hypothetical protein